MVNEFFAPAKSGQLHFVKKILVFLLLVACCPSFSQAVSIEEVKKEADKLFKEEDYSAAYKLYSQLVSSYPKEPEYNFRLGVCMIYSEPNKKKSIDYLKFAVNNPDKTTKDALFYLAKAYHINYLFDEAIRNYRLFKSSASGAQLKKYQVDREISSCENGKHLLSTFTDIEVITRVVLPESDYFRSYKKTGGKLLVKPDEFKSSVDKKKKEKSVVFLPNGSDVVYFSSYGDNTESGKDLYTASKLADGSYSKPKKVEGLNTEFDEDYPFLHPNGNTLYFASKGHNSMGGYDIFKSIFNSETTTWSNPVNMEFPINSPDDDFLFVTDSLETTAYFSTGRQSLPGKIDVLKVKTKRRPVDLFALKGMVLPGDPSYDLNSSITVQDLYDQKEIGKYTADETGNYTMELPNGGKLLFTVETNGIETQSAEVTLPVSTTSKPCRQSISYEGGKLKVLNYFDEPAKDDDYLQYLSLIEKKAKLEVNEREARPEPAAEKDSLGVPVTQSSINKKPTINEETSAVPSKGTDNKQLAKLAKKDAQEAKSEGAQLMRDYIAANEEAIKQKEIAGKKLNESNSAILAAESISNELEKNAALDKAIALKESAEIEQVISSNMLDYAAALDEDVKRKEKEAELNAEYAKELEKNTSGKNNVVSSEKLESIQKEIEGMAKQGSAAENYLSSVRSTLEQKESQISSMEELNAGVKINLQEVRTAITDKEEELAATKKKAAKQNIAGQISELNAEKEEKETLITTNNAQIRNLNNEVTALKTGLELADKISAENLSIALLDNAVNQKVTSSYLQEKYKTKTSFTDSGDLTSINESSRQLSNYNKEIDAAIQTNKSDLAKTKNKTEKQEFNSEIKQLESLKKQNQQKIASNNKLIKDLNQPQAIAAATVNTTYVALVAATSEEAIKKLDNLSKELSVNENENFDYNAYQNPEAQSLKVEADTKINEAIAKQKILKDEIITSKQAIQAGVSSSAIGSSNLTALTKESEDLALQAQKTREEAKDAKGKQKEKLLLEAKELDEKSTNKSLEVAELVKNDHAAIIAVNDENIQNLIKENKANNTEIEQAKALNEEATNAMKKATVMRQEAASAKSTGAKLGGLSNAEEKESSAMLKQGQALEILLKTNPDFTLKTPFTSSAAANTEISPKADVNTQLSSVNTQLTELASIKTESYLKLYEANQTEINLLVADLKKNPAVQNTPSYKTELLSIEKKAEAAKAFKQTADNSITANDKLNNLIISVKKQNEVLKQTSASKASLSKVPVASVPIPTVETNTENALAGGTADALDELVQLGELNTGNDAPALGTLAEQDTSAAQVLTYFTLNNPAVKNAEANTQVQTSLVRLKNLEDQNSSLNTELKKVQKMAEGANAGISTIEDMNEYADELIEEADPMLNKSLELKKSAASKKGEGKDLLLAKALQIEIEAQDKLLQASEFRQKANENDYNATTPAIDELLEKLKTDNPELASQLTDKKDAYTPLKVQVTNLREEANALNNKAAKLGAISNAEEKEIELITKQKALLAELQKQYPDYVVKAVSGKNPEEEIAQIQKTKADIREKQFAELTALTNAFSLEYESSKNSVPQQLTDNQQKAKQNAEGLNAESKKLLIQSASVTDVSEKFQLLSLAAKSGKTAIDELSKVVQAQSKPEIDVLAEIGNRITTSTENTAAPSKGTVKITGLEVVQGNAYSAANPIPIDAKMEDGLIFRVQIGAFKTQLPNNAFKGLSPLNGETTASGYFRYTAGNFDQIEPANAVKNDLRNLGYSDAFVVVYYNGKRISLGEAMAMMEKDGIKMDPNAPQTAGITGKANVPKAIVNTAIQESVEVTKELEQTNGLLYTIQIGVYTKQVSKPQILRLKPVFREQLSNGLFRYTAGIYIDSERLMSDKNKVVEMGVKDAFVSAYLNGKRISYADAKEKQAADASMKLEPENPIVFPEKQVIPAPNPFEQLVASSPSAVEPFKNNVNNYPASTPDNGVKENEQGIAYKVQIGAFSKQVPSDVEVKFSAIKNWPIDNKRINGLFIYNVGNFSESKFAKAFKEEIIRLGINDAFITVYRDGSKIYGPEAENLIR
jgi:hypothetical protein